MKQIIFVIIVVTTLGLNAQTNNKKWEIYFQKADSLFDKGEFKNAIIYYDSVIIINPGNTEAYTYRGVSRYELKEYTMAIEDFNYALILAPGYAEVYFYRGMCYMEKQMKAQACQDWQTAYSFGYRKALKVLEQNCEEELKMEIEK